MVLSLIAIFSLANTFTQLQFSSLFHEIILLHCVDNESVIVVDGSLGDRKECPQTTPDQIFSRNNVERRRDHSNQHKQQ